VLGSTGDALAWGFPTALPQAVQKRAPSAIWAPHCAQYIVPPGSTIRRAR